MITRIELTNFMSHTSTVIEPSPGLTVFVGPNNCGKSAVFSAIECTLRCFRGDFMRRHNATSCSVAITMSDGTTLGFRRGKGPSALALNGESGISYDPDGCERLSTAAKLPTIDVGGATSTIDVHFGAQKQPLFLVDAPEGVVAKFFASSSDAGKLLEMKRRLTSRQQEDQRALKRIDAQIAAREKVLTALAPVPALEVAFEQVTNLRDALVAEERAISALVKRIEQLAAAHRAVLAAAAAHEALADLGVPPELHDDAAAGQMVERLGRTTKSQESLATQHRVALATLPPPSLADESPLATLVNGLDAAARTQHVALAEHRALAPLTPPQVLPETAPLEAALVKLAACQSALARGRAEISVLTELREVPAEVDALPLRKLGVELKSAATEVQVQEKERDTVAEAFKAAADAVNEAMMQLGTCPTCDRPFTSTDHLHGGAA